MIENQYGKFHNDRSAKRFAKGVAFVEKIKEYQKDGYLILYKDSPMKGKFVVQIGDNPLLGLKDGNSTWVFFGFSTSIKTGLVVIDKEDMDIFSKFAIIPLDKVIKLKI